MSHRILFIFPVLSFLVVLVSPIADCNAQEPSPEKTFWDDERLASWNQLFLDGQRQEVLERLEQDLETDSPHVLAGCYWYETAKSLGKLDSELARVKSTPAYQRLADVCEIFRLRNKGLNHECVEKYPNPRKVNDLMAVLRLAWCAGDLKRPELEFAYAAEALRREPTCFFAAAILCGIPSDDGYHLKEKIETLVSSDPTLRDSAAAKYILDELADPNRSDGLDRLDRLDRFLLQHPGDRQALLYRGSCHYAVGQFQESFEDYHAASEQMPVWPRYDFAARGLIRQQEYLKARKYIAKWVKLFSNAERDAETLTEERTAYALRRAGEHGRARDVLKPHPLMNEQKWWRFPDRKTVKPLEVPGGALSKWPNDKELNEEMARLEIADGRAKEAVQYAKVAAQSDPADLSLQELYLECLRKSDPYSDEAYDAWLETRKRFKNLTPTVYYEGMSLLQSSERFEELVELSNEAVMSYPRSAWMRAWNAIALEASGDFDAAANVAKKSIEIDPGYSFGISKAHSLVSAVDGPEAASKLLVDHRDRYPWVKKTWQVLADEISDEEKRIELWQAAAKANPNEWWPWEPTVTLFLDTRMDWENGRLAIARMRAASAGKPRSYKAMVAQNDAYYYDRKCRRTRLSEQELTYWNDACFEMKKYGTPAKWVEFNSDRFFHLYHLARGEQELAGAKLRALAEAHPDSTMWNNAFNDDLTDDIKLGNTYLLGYHAIERRPFDGERIGRVAERHLQWSGSPVNAYFLYDLLQNVDPKIYADKDVMHAKCASFFSDSREYYAKEFRNSTNIGSEKSSERYIHWFRRARANSRFLGARVEFTFQEGFPSVAITHPDGTVERRDFHPISGEQTRVQVGKNFIRAEFEVVGNHLTRVETSSGEWVAMKYDGDRINQVTCSNGVEYRIDYYPSGNPKTYTVNGEKLHITYLPNQEVDEVSGVRSAQINLGKGNDLLVRLSRQFTEAKKSGLPNLSIDDVEMERLREKAANSNSLPDQANDFLTLCRYLIAHLHNDRTYSARARELLDDLSETLIDIGPESSVWRLNAVLETLALRHELYIKTRFNGLSAADYADFQRNTEWIREHLLDHAELSDKAKTLLAMIKKQPVTLLQSSQWVPRSDFAVKGFWKRHAVRDVMPKNLHDDSVQVNCVQMRSNGDVLVGTSKGLGVYRRGFWEWFCVDEKRFQLTREFEPDDVSAWSDILAICVQETKDESVIWLGTASGLIRFPGDYSVGKRLTRWSGESDNLPSPRITSLAFHNDGLYLGTPRGIRRLAAGTITKTELLGDEQIQWMRSILKSDGSSLLPHDSRVDEPQGAQLKDTVLVGTSQGIYAIVGDDQPKPLILEKEIADAVYVAVDKKLVYLQNNSILSAFWQPGKKFRQRVRQLDGFQDVLKRNEIESIGQMQIDKESAAIAVLTDTALNFWYDRHVETLPLPMLADRDPEFQQMHSFGRDAVFLTSEGIYLFQRASAKGDDQSPAHAIATSKEHRRTAVARGNRVEFYRHDQLNADPEVVENLECRIVDVNQEGDFILNDGQQILRVEFKNDILDFERLFIAKSSLRPDDSPQHLTVGKDGTIWVSIGTGSSGEFLIRWKKGMEDPETLSYRIDPERFPSKTTWVSRVIETVDDRTLIVCSDERHLTENGVAMEGGILEWDGKQFIRLDVDQDAFKHWFVTGYTPVSETTAIVGTTRGFTRHSGGEFSSYEQREDVTYQELSKHTKQLMLGTDGAKIGEDTWLFGTAGGVVGWTAGKWFYPDRLNWFLPADSDSAYGSRCVNAISATESGVLFVGTDRGLLIHDGGGTDMLTFSDDASLAIQMANQRQLEKQREVLVDAYVQKHPESELAKQLAKIQTLKEKERQLAKRLSPGVELTRSDETGRSERKSMDSSDRERLLRQRKLAALSHFRAIERLKRDFPGAVQLLQVKPLDVRSVRQSLDDDEAIVQYIVSGNSTYINVVTTSQEQLIKVDVSKDVLLNRASAVTKFLRNQATSARPMRVATQVEPIQLDWKSELVWLYDQLLRPIESDLAGIKHVHIVTPLGPLRYLPIEALIRRDALMPEYAILSRTFSYWPDMQFYSLCDEGASLVDSSQSLVMGDPDATLDGARREARAVHLSLSSQLPLYIGDEATESNFNQHCEDCTVLHLATHGMLNFEKPEESCLLMADGKLEVPEIGVMSLPEANLAVLSACESGLTGDGVECASLARAFAHAGVPRVVATLWKVNDQASESLMKSFYENLNDDVSVAKSLANAKRTMIENRKNSLNKPWMWAGYVAFGDR